MEFPSNKMNNHIIKVIRKADINSQLDRIKR